MTRFDCRFYTDDDLLYMVRKVYEWSPALTRSQGRPKNRWEDDVNNNITRMKITNWKDCIRNRNEWKKLVEKAKTSSKL
jgi:hypothetical protein